MLVADMTHYDGVLSLDPPPTALSCAWASTLARSPGPRPWRRRANGSERASHASADLPAVPARPFTVRQLDLWVAR
jgi:hypothetical protein